MQLFCVVVNSFSPSARAFVVDSRSPSAVASSSDAADLARGWIEEQCGVKKESGEYDLEKIPEHKHYLCDTISNVKAKHAAATTKT